MKVNFHDQNRDGKHYPVLEIDVADLVDRYIEEIDIDEFIQNNIGHEKFLDYAVSEIIEAYSGTNMYTNMNEARGKLLEAIGDKYLKVKADEVAGYMRTEKYYQDKYFQLYHGLGDFMNSRSMEENQALNRFLDSHKSEHECPEIGSDEWSRYGEDCKNQVLSMLKDKLKKETKS